VCSGDADEDKNLRAFLPGGSVSEIGMLTRESEKVSRFLLSAESGLVGSSYIFAPHFGHRRTPAGGMKPHFKQAFGWAVPIGAPQAGHVGSPTGAAAPQ
jgi:hypothetical protein